MTPLQIILIIILVIILVTGTITYFTRGKYYEEIDRLDQEKKELLDQAPHDQLQEVSKLSITGQSSELREEFKDQWNDIQSVKYPKLENYLFEAEQAADRYRLNESKKNQEAAKELIENLKNDINELTTLLTELIEQEQANLEKIDAIKKRYHEVRKSLLAYSFSFGPASESFEEKLNLMEEDFTEFSEYTLSGDHEEANKVIDRLSDDIQQTEEEMDEIPELLTKMEKEYKLDIEDLDEGYQKLVDQNYLFPDNNLSEEIEQLKVEQNQILEDIGLLKLKEGKQEMKDMSDKIDDLYEIMEKEIKAEANISPTLKKVKEAIYYLRDEIQQLLSLEKRLEQSYILVHKERESLESIEKQLEDAMKEYDIILEKIEENKTPYSVADNQLNYLFKNLSKLNDEKILLKNTLNDYRKEELHFKEEMHAMEEAMYDMKRALENKRLPGLPDDYLELFFSASRRIEKLSEDLARTKVSLGSVKKLHQIAEEDVIQLSRMTEEIIDQVNLIERSSQRLYRYKDQHKGILETIRYSESLFNDDYEYDTSLRLLKEKLENVAPGSYEQLEKEYEQENSFKEE